MVASKLVSCPTTASPVSPKFPSRSACSCPKLALLDPLPLIPACPSLLVMPSLALRATERVAFALVCVSVSLPSYLTRSHGNTPLVFRTSPARLSSPSPACLQTSQGTLSSSSCTSCPSTLLLHFRLEFLLSSLSFPLMLRPDSSAYSLVCRCPIHPLVRLMLYFMSTASSMDVRVQDVDGGLQPLPIVLALSAKQQIGLAFCRSTGVDIRAALSIVLSNVSHVQGLAGGNLALKEVTHSRANLVDGRLIARVS